MKKILYLLLIVCVAFGSAEAAKKKRKKKKKARVEAAPPPPVVEVPVDTTPPPPPPPPMDTVPAEPAIKPYERIKLVLDSTTNLIIYTSVVEQPESSSDSLYSRAKKWAAKKFKDNKKLYEVDMKNQKIIMKCEMPAYAYVNKYTKRPIGTYYFKMTVWFKEERYKYSITNLAHEAAKGNIAPSPRNYFEYYNTTTNNVKSVDQILRYADKDINELIENFKKAMANPLQVDEDEW